MVLTGKMAIKILRKRLACWTTQGGCWRSSNRDSELIQTAATGRAAIKRIHIPVRVSGVEM